MKIYVRCSGERTESACIKLAALQGEPVIIRARPFGEAIRECYRQGIKAGDKYTVVVDADVLLYPGTIARGINELESQPISIFCLDGKTDDKIMMRSRRAGIHIYRTGLLKTALDMVDDNYIKPESLVRQRMEARGHKTYVGPIVFGRHDYDQYYRDLWRKSVAQTQKLGGVFHKKGEKIRHAWVRLTMKDPDYRVIYEAHKYGQKYKRGEIVIDIDKDYGAGKNLARLNIKEKGPL